MSYIINELGEPIRIFHYILSILIYRKDAYVLVMIVISNKIENIILSKLQFEILKIYAVNIKVSYHN